MTVKGSAHPPFVPLAPNATLRWSVVRRKLDELIKPSSILEMGCGQGGFGARLAARGGSYVGVEPDAQSSAVARERIEPVGGTVLTGTIDDVPKDDRFDLICAFEVIEHIEDDLSILRGWLDRAKPGGWVMVSVPAWQHRMGKWDEMVGHYRRYDPPALASVLRSAGCEWTEITAYGWPLGYLTENVRNFIAKRGGGHSQSEDGAASMETRTAASGRVLQPKNLAATAVRIGTAPFAQIQRLRPGSGTGLVGIGRLPS